jgi:hypothetical protein
MSRPITMTPRITGRVQIAPAPRRPPYAAAIGGRPHSPGRRWLRQAGIPDAARRAGKATQPRRSQARRGQHDGQTAARCHAKGGNQFCACQQHGAGASCRSILGAVEKSDTSASLLQGQAVAAAIRASILAQNRLKTKS